MLISGGIKFIDRWMKAARGIWSFERLESVSVHVQDIKIFNCNASSQLVRVAQPLFQRTSAFVIAVAEHKLGRATLNFVRGIQIIVPCHLCRWSRTHRVAQLLGEAPIASRLHILIL
jgi:hypothetical protein